MAARQAIELDGAAGRQVGKILFDLPVDGKAMFRQKRFHLGIDTVFAMRLAHKIEHGKAILARAMAQSPAELLKEYSQTLGGAQKQNNVDIRQIHAFA